MIENADSRNIGKQDSLQDLAAKLLGEKPMKKDFVVPSEKISLVNLKDHANEDFPGGMYLRAENLPKPSKEAPIQTLAGITQAIDSMRFEPTYTGYFNVTEICHQQLAQKSGIPRKYYDKMKEAGKLDLLTDNVNQWIQDEPAKNRMIRTLGNDARALLSDRYLRIDHDVILGAAVKAISELEEPVDLQRADLTESSMYLKFTMPNQKELVKEGDPFVRGVVVRNSEVGLGSMTVEPFLLRLVCSNGMIGSKTVGRVHLGKRLETGGLITDKTRELENAAIVSGVVDAVTNTFSADFFHNWMDEIRESEGIPIENKTAAVKLLVDHYKLSDGVLDQIINRFEGANAYGLVNAVTQTAHEFMGSYEGQISLERVGGELVANKHLLDKLSVVQ